MCVCVSERERECVCVRKRESVWQMCHAAAADRFPDVYPQYSSSVRHVLQTYPLHDGLPPQKCSLFCSFKQQTSYFQAFL